MALLVETDSPTAIYKRVNLIDDADVLIHSAEHALQIAWAIATVPLRGRAAAEAATPWEEKYPTDDPMGY